MILLSYVLVFAFGLLVAGIKLKEDETFATWERYAAIVIVAFMLFGIYSWATLIQGWLK